MEAERSRRMKLGWKVGGALAVLTLLEFAVAVSLAQPLAPLALIAFAKAGLIAEYFMHLSQLWSSEGGH